VVVRAVEMVVATAAKVTAAGAMVAEVRAVWSFFD